MQQITIRDALQQSGRDIDDIDARILLQYALDVSHAHLIAHAEQALDSKQAQSFRLLTARRAQGEPVAYLTGKREFYSLGFTVTPAVLIPRPETELLVDLALAQIPPGMASKALELSSDGLTLTYSFDTQQEETGIAGLLRKLGDNSIEFKDLRTSESSLEDIFVSLVHRPKEVTA